MSTNYKAIYIFFLISFVFYLFTGCQETTVTQSTDSQTVNQVRDGEKIYIIDRTGKRWDITHASNRYGFRADQFQYGLGPDAIQSIDYPPMFLPGETGYPLLNDDFMIIGTRFDQDARAYPIFVMKSHEIVNEKISGNHVAVAY